MLFSKSYIFTLKENPRDACIRSHELMLRACLIKKSSAGLYTWMPLGKRVLDKVVQIVKQEMDRAGALDMLPPFITQGDLWKETGRWDTMGKEMLRFKDRHDNDYVLGPTHEEAFTAIVRETAQSYQDFPVTFYQINTKFRDEIRPRYGMIRCREFIMKDAYSYDIDEAGLDKSYQAMRDAYLRIFQRIGLLVDPVLADSGTMGGTGSEEFMVPSSVGEEDIIRCSCGYVANVEKADSIIPERLKHNEESIKKVDTPGIKTIDDLALFFHCETKDLIKAFVVEADGNLVMACIRGDLQINETKLKNLLGALELQVADPQKIAAILNTTVGFLGPKDISIDVIADQSVLDMCNAIIGANEDDMHYQGVTFSRDCKITKTGVFHKAEENHSCIQCQAMLKVYKGIEVGHIFKLGRKYTKSMNVKVLDQNNQPITPICGSYGIGIGRVIAALIEQGADNEGIIFPIAIAPYHLIIIPVSIDGEIFDAAYSLYKTLAGNNIEVLFDDRNQRPGVKFKDADLIGIPIRITVGKLWHEKREFEVKLRRTSQIIYISESNIIQDILMLIQKEYEVSI